MPGDPIQTEPQTERSASAASHEWYVVTGGGGSALRLTPGLTVGESDAGTLVLNDPDVRNQWIEFVLAENGEPWATIVTRDKSLRVGETNCLRHPLWVGVAVRLPNNTLHISRDIRPPRHSGTVVEVVHRDIPERLQDLVGPGWEELLAAVREPQPGTPAAALPESALPADPSDDADARLEPIRGTADEWSDPLTVAEPRRPPSAARRRQAAVLTGVLALGTLTLAGVVAVLVSLDGREAARVSRFDAPPVRDPRFDRPVETPAPAEPSGGASLTIADPMQALPGERETTDSRPPPAADVMPPEPATAADQETGQVALGPRAAPALPEPVLVPPVARREMPPAEEAAIPPATQTAPQTAPQPTVEATAQTRRAAEAPAIGEPADEGPDPALVTELEEIGATARAVATELTRRRDLLAADLAFTQGRLTTPAESSAYTLYSRVLAVDPGSPEASRGLQAVRQGLINRVLAQLAGAELTEARRTLDAAEDAGADSTLIADLRNEVDYRQALIEGGSR